MCLCNFDFEKQISQLSCPYDDDASEGKQKLFYLALFMYSSHNASTYRHFADF